MNYSMRVMELLYSGVILASVVFAGLVSSDVSIQDHLSSLPGHLQPLGTGRPIKKVEEIQGFPEPQG